MTAETLRQMIDAINAAIHSGDIERMSRVELVRFNAALCNDEARNYFNGGYAETCETVRFHLLRSMMESFEDRSKKTERWVMALAVMSLISSVIQIFSPLLFQAPPSALVQPAPIVQLSCPALASPQTCGQATKKKP